MKISNDLIIVIIFSSLIIYCAISGILKHFNVSVSKFVFKRKTKKESEVEKKFMNIDKDMSIPCRGENLDKQLQGYFVRNHSENDWDYVKRIFLVIFLENPCGALNILYGQPVENIKDAHWEITSNFLKRYYRSSSVKKELHLRLFLQTFKHDPVAKLK